MSEKTYHDSSDMIFARATQPAPLSYVWWWLEDRRVFALMRRDVAAWAPSRGHFLDAGCGWGRMVLEIGRGFREVTAVEPDQARLDIARRNISIRRAGVRYVCSTIEALPHDLTADVVMCSHVLQHLPTTLVPQILRALHAHLSPGGLLLLAVARSRGEEDDYARSFDHPDTGRATTELIGREEFDQIASAPAGGVLPTHGFSERGLEHALADAGFTLRRVARSHFTTREHDSFSLGDVARGLVTRRSLNLYAAATRNP